MAEVYIQELPSGTRTIVGVPTSVTAFVGRARRGPVDDPVTISSYAEYERQFGGLWRESAMSYAVQQFFVNGGLRAVIVRVTTRNDTGGIDPAAWATLDLGAGNTLAAASPGTWGRNLEAWVDHDTGDQLDPSATPDDKLFNLTLFDDPAPATGVLRGGSGLREIFEDVSLDASSPRFVTAVLAEHSHLARVTALGATRPAETPIETPILASSTSGSDGDPLEDSDVVGASDQKTGIHALSKTDIFNLLCLPPLEPGPGGADVSMATWTAAAKLCAERRAFLIVDAPADWDVTRAVDSVDDFSAIDRNHAALYFPRLRIPDSLQENELEDFAPCGVIAGVISRTDSARGVWKAPAGLETDLQGVLGLSINGRAGDLTDGEVGLLTPLGINSLRAFPVIGHVIWGARTLEGANVLGSQWKYIPVRRLSLYVEESLFRGTQWVVFEPNHEPLWAQIRLHVGAFMHTLFLQGALRGTTPKDAYFVKCDSATTTPTDIDNGIVNIVVGFAPLRPAEFVVISIRQIRYCRS